MKLRPYQKEAVTSTLEALVELKHPLCVLPTGSGKSLCIAETIRRKNCTVLVLSHVKELLEQDSKALRELAPEIPQTFYVAGLKEKRGVAQVVFGSVQSVARNLKSLSGRELIIVDEAHLVPRKESALYSRVFAHFSLALRAGFTATPNRTDSGSLLGGANPWFTFLAYKMEVRDLIEKKYLAPLVGVLVEHQADLSDVKRRGGEYIPGAAQRAVASTLAVDQVADDIMRFARKRNHWLIFAAGVEHATTMLTELRARGVDVEIVTAKTASGERAKIIKKFKAGKLRALIGVGVFTTGFDAPQTDCIISLRPTASLVLWPQMLGRGMRISKGKQNCLLLDFVGNLDRLGGAGCVIDMVDRRDTSDEEKVAVHGRAVAREIAEVEYQPVSLTDPMKDGRMITCSVQHMEMVVRASRRQPGAHSLVAIYKCTTELDATPMRPVAFVPVEFGGAARHYALTWFRRRGISNKDDVPRSADLARKLGMSLPKPKRIEIYWEPRLKNYMVAAEEFDPREIKKREALPY